MFLRDEVAGSHDAKQIETTACGAYTGHAHQAQEESHDYEAVALKDVRHLPPARVTSSPTQKTEGIPPSSRNEPCASWF